MKHTVKRVSDGCGGYIPQLYEYRGYEIYKKDTYAWGIMGRKGYWNTRVEVVEWIDKRLTAKESK